MADYEFSYWGIRGLAQPMRFLWAHLGLKVNDIFADREEWFGKLKPEQAKTFDFPNLPYIKKGDYILTESVAIAQYLCYEANREDMVGASVKERLENTMIHGCVMDLRTQMFKICMNKEKYLEDKEKLLGENCVPKLDKLEKHCGEFVNGKLTYVDFFLYECLAFLSKVDGALVAKYPKLCAMMKKFSELKGVKEIFASEDFKKMQFMPAVYIHESIENHQ